MNDDAFTAALAEFRRCKAIEDCLSPTDDEGEQALGRATEATNQALLSMINAPSRGQADGMAKIEAIISVYDAVGTPHLVEEIGKLFSTIRSDAQELLAALPDPFVPLPAAKPHDPIPGGPAHSGWLSRFRASRWAWLEPWYDWGSAGLSHHGTYADGDGWHAGIDWLGLHLKIFIGASPAACVIVPRGPSA